MPIRMALWGVICLTALAFVGTGRAAEDGPYPVWWSDKLELDSLDQVEARLHRDLWPDSPDGFPLFKGEPDNYVTVEAHSCESLSRLTEEGYSALSSNDRWALNHLLSDCRAIAMIARAKPAALSHLRDFVMDAAALDYLPALVNLYPSCSSICYAVAANQRGIPYTTLETSLAIDLTSDDEMTVWTTGWMAHLTVMARGDFTADGVDDMLLISSGGATEGSWKTARLYLMTRDAPGAVLRVVDAERESCPDRGCPSPSLFFHQLKKASAPPSPADIGGSVDSSSSEGTVDQKSPPHPVWWSHGFELEGLDQVDARIRRKFWSSMDLGIQVSKGSYDDYVEAEARNCVELETLTQAGYGLPEGSLHMTQMHHLLKCRTIARIGTAKPARESYLRDFAIDEKGTRELLRAFELFVGGDAPSPSGKWILTGGLGELLVVDLPYGGDADVWAAKGRVLLRVEARGDFTGDGIEDLLLSAGTSLSRFRPDLTDLCLITRPAPGAPLRMIEVAPYSCQGLGRYGRSADGDD